MSPIIPYHKPSFVTKAVLKKDYKELVDFCDELLIDEGKKNDQLAAKNKEIAELKRMNFSLMLRLNDIRDTIEQAAEDSDQDIEIASFCDSDDEDEECERCHLCNNYKGKYYEDSTLICCCVEWEEDYEAM